MKNFTIFLLLAIGIVAIVFFTRRCETQTTTETIIKVIDKPDAVLKVTAPDVMNFDTLIAKGVELDSLRTMLAQVSRRYSYYKSETLSLRERVASLQSELRNAPDCAARGELLERQIEKLSYRNEQNVRLIDSLFSSIAQANKVNTYTFKERDEIHRRTTEVTVVGWLPPGGYRVTDKRYFIPETTTRITTLQRSYPMRSMSALAGTQFQGTSIRPAYGAGYRWQWRRFGVGTQAIVLPVSGQQDAAIQLLGQVSINLGGFMRGRGR